MKKKLFTNLLTLSIVCTSVGFAGAENIDATNSTFEPISTEIRLLNENSEERYVQMKALELNISISEANRLNEEENNNITRAADEYISYRTVEKSAGSIRTTNFGSIGITIGSEFKCLVNRATNKVVRVEDFGMPYSSTNDYFVDFDHGGFNINRTGDKSARVSATGTFYMDESVGIGGDILSYSASGTVKSKIKTISTTMNI